MKTLVVYKSRLGATEKYAKWLAEALNTEAKKFKEVKRNEIKEAKIVVVLSGTYIGHMPLVRFLKRRWRDLEGKKVFAIAVGAAPADDPWSLKNYEKIPKKIRSGVKYFKLISAMDEKTREKDIKKDNLSPVLEEIRKIKK